MLLLSDSSKVFQKCQGFPGKNGLQTLYLMGVSLIWAF